jgi:hypothetical protein
MVKYTQEQIKIEFEGWKYGSIKRDQMSSKQWYAMKRRINRAGFKKIHTDYVLSKKQCNRQEWLAKHALYQRTRYAAQKSKLADTIDIQCHPCILISH